VHYEEQSHQGETTTLSKCVVHGILLVVVNLLELRSSQLRSNKIYKSLTD